jgi:glycosyltransferase involved in cell wall biosynthesis
MFVSFIVATYNCGHLTSEFLQGIDELHFEDYEVLISDGGSTDGTVNRLVANNRIKIIKSSTDQGIYDAWNYALDHTSGDYISFIGIDDRPGGKFLESAKEYCNKIQINPALIYGNAIIKRGRRTRLKRPSARLDFFETDSLVFDFVHPGALNHKDIFKTNRFDPSFRLAGDIDFYLGSKLELRRIGIKKLEEIQVTVGATGLSNGPDAYSIYYDEFKRIGKKRLIDFSTLLARYSIRRSFRHVPTIFSWARDLSWLINSQKEE